MSLPAFYNEINNFPSILEYAIEFLNLDKQYTYQDLRLAVSAKKRTLTSAEEYNKLVLVEKDLKARLDQIYNQHTVAEVSVGIEKVIKGGAVTFTFRGALYRQEIPAGYYKSRIVTNYHYRGRNIILIVNIDPFQPYKGFTFLNKRVDDYRYYITISASVPKIILTKQQLKDLKSQVEVGQIPQCKYIGVNGETYIGDVKSIDDNFIVIKDGGLFYKKGKKNHTSDLYTVYKII